MNACMVARKPQEGRECFEYMSKLGFGERAGLEEMIQVLSYDPEEATKMLEEYDRRGVNRTRGAYHSLIVAWGKKKEMVKAEELFEDMQGREIKVNNGSLCAMMRAYLLNGNSEKALEYFGQFEERGIEAGVRAYALAIQVGIHYLSIAMSLFLFNGIKN